MMASTSPYLSRVTDSYASDIVDEISFSFIVSPTSISVSEDRRANVLKNFIVFMFV